MDSIPTIDPLGNLIASDDMIIAQNGLWLRAFYQKEKLRTNVQRRLADNAQDPWALEHHGYLLLEDGERNQGLQALREAISHYPTLKTPGIDYSAKKRLVDETFAMLLEEDQPEALALADAIEPYLPESRRAEFYRVLTVRNLKAGRVEAAFKSNLQLCVDSITDASRMQMEPPTMEFPHRKIRADRWHRAVFLSAWQAANHEQRQLFEQLVRAELDQLAGSQRESLVEICQDMSFVHPDYLDMLANRMQDKVRPPFVEGVLLRLSASQDPRVAGRAAALLARLYHSAGQRLAAAWQYQRLREEFADVVLVGEQTGAALVAAAERESPGLQPYLQFAASGQSWAYGKPTTVFEEVEQTPVRRPTFGYGLSSLNGFAALESDHGPEQPLGMRWVVSQLPGTQIELRDPMGRATTALGAMFSNTRGGREPIVRTNGHYAVAVYDNSIVAVDGLRGHLESVTPILWRDARAGVSRPATSPVREFTIGETGLTRRLEYGASGRSAISLGCVTDRGVVFRRGGDLVCVDPESGEQLWLREDVPVESEVWGDEEYVFVHVDQRFSNGSNEARVFSVLDGSEVGQRMVPSQVSRVRMFGRYVVSWKKDVGPEFQKNFDPNRVVEGILQTGDRREADRRDRSAFGNHFEMRNVMNAARRIEWSRDYSNLAKAAWVGYSELAIYDPRDGRFEILSVLDGETRVLTKIETQLSSVDAIHVQKKTGLYVLAMGENSDGKVRGEVRYRSPISIRPLQNIELYAFSERGEMVWGVPARLSHFRQLPIFADGLPLLVFARQNEVDASRRKREFETVVLDVRDGRLLFEDRGTYRGSSRFRCTGRVGDEKIELQLPSQQGIWTLQFSREPRSPSLPYGYETSQVLKQNSRNVLGAVFDLFMPQPPDEEDDE